MASNTRITHDYQGLVCGVFFRGDFFGGKRFLLGFLEWVFLWNFFGKLLFEIFLIVVGVFE